jgi:small-conductance mechanosensitive channel
MKHLKTQKQLNEGQENLNISDVISSLLQLKQHLEDKRVSDKDTLKLFKQIENQVKDLEMYRQIYGELEDKVHNLFDKKTSLSEIGDYITTEFGCK